jgi:hypothetical protein
MPSDGPLKDSKRMLQGMVKTCMPTIVKQALRFELGVSQVLNPN